VFPVIAPDQLASVLQASGTITSTANPRVREAARLRDAAARRASGCTLIDGLREITRGLAAGIELVEVFVAADILPHLAEDSYAMLANCLGQLASHGVPLVPLANRAFAKIAFGSRNEGLVAMARFAAPTLERFAPTPGRPLLIVEEIEKPGNLGAILRSADAAGMGGVIACGSGTDPANPATIRGSLGTVFTVPLAVATTPDAIAWCGKACRQIWAATPEGDRLWHEAPLDGEVAVLLGSEAHGITPAWSEAGKTGAIMISTLRLPMLGMADSLNVAATAAVLAYESLRQRASAPSCTHLADPTELP
jgi:TrmH family RNA methyltransferase